MTDDHPLMCDDRDLSNSGSRHSTRYQTTISCEGCGVHIGTGDTYCDDCSPPSPDDDTVGEDGGLGADLVDPEEAEKAGDGDD